MLQRVLIILTVIEKLGECFHKNKKVIKLPKTLRMDLSMRVWSVSVVVELVILSIFFCLFLN